jgi:hypothetical protein
MKMDKAGIEYKVVEDIKEMEGLGIKSLPHLQLEEGKLLDFSGALAFVKEMEAAQ